MAEVFGPYTIRREKRLVRVETTKSTPSSPKTFGNQPNLVLIHFSTTSPRISHIRVRINVAILQFLVPKWIHSQNSLKKIKRYLLQVGRMCNTSLYFVRTTSDNRFSVFSRRFGLRPLDTPHMTPFFGSCRLNQYDTIGGHLCRNTFTT